MTYKVICFPSGVTTETATDMKTLAASLDSDPLMILALQHIDAENEPYQAIKFAKKGIVQVNYIDGPKFIKADSISAALSDDDPTDEYILLSKKPSDWETAYASYFVKDDDDFVAVEGVEETVYSPAYEPNKYYLLADEEYVLLTQAEAPDDWGTATYYTSDGAQEPSYTEVTFTSEQVTVAPEFVKNTYYKKESL